jgi:hypothetical protein
MAAMKAMGFDVPAADRYWRVSDIRGARPYDDRFIDRRHYFLANGWENYQHFMVICPSCNAEAAANLRTLSQMSEVPNPIHPVDMHKHIFVRSHNDPFAAWIGVCDKCKTGLFSFAGRENLNQTWPDFVPSAIASKAT